MTVDQVRKFLKIIGFIFGLFFLWLVTRRLMGLEVFPYPGGSR